ncbi:NHLP leader peptide family RiPP precursor [Thermodesulfobacteriota bacterium]
MNEEDAMQEAFQGKEKEWAKVIAQAWVDEEFKAKLLADPKAVLKAEGIEFPENIKLNIAEAKEDELNLTLPLKPTDFTGSVQELQERMQAVGVPDYANLSV